MILCNFGWSYLVLLMLMFVLVTQFHSLCPLSFVFWCIVCFPATCPMYFSVQICALKSPDIMTVSSFGSPSISVSNLS